MKPLLAGRACVVAGVGAGTGRAVALALAREGADIVLACRTEAVAAEVGAEIARGGGRAIAVACDITEPADRARLVAAAVNAYGGIDVLVNNAFAVGRIGPIESSDIAKAWRAPFEVNLFGTLQLTQAVLPSMKERGGGSIVMVGTMAAQHPEPGLAAYGASKAALLAAARSLAAEVGRHRIRVNTVVPGYIDGPNLRIHFQAEAKRLGVTEEEVRRRIAGLAALNHIAQPEEIADAVLFFASAMSASITGQSLNVNCGQSLS